MKQSYKNIKIGKPGLLLIEHVNRVIDEYRAEGYTFTVRQVYYRLVAEAIIENTAKSYKNFGNHVKNGRLAGYIDWSAIEDRTRIFRKPPAWDSPAQILEGAAEQYKRDLWETQDNYVEVRRK